MLTLAYCRVSTEEQAEEGFSIEGQAERLRLYAQLRDLGDVTVVTDPGKSGKNLERPGLQQVLAAVEAGHVSHVLVWRLDRLSRNLADLILLADLLGEHGVALHSVTENLDLSSAAGRMFYNILGTFAQYFREQLSENVRMGTQRAAKEGKWMNRPKTGYDLVDKHLVVNGDAPRVQEVFRLRAEGLSYPKIEAATGIKYSTARAIIQSRIYRGEVLHGETWYAGQHDAIVTESEWLAANRHNRTGTRRSKDVLSGRVLCGLCGRRMVVAQNGQGQLLYRCYHRGAGCDLPGRSNVGLQRAMLLGLRLIREDENLRDAIRRNLADRGSEAPATAVRTRRASASTLAKLSEERRKLLDLYFKGKISEDGFQEAESRIEVEIRAATEQARQEAGAKRQATELEAKFEQVAKILETLDVDLIWKAATDQERKILIDNFVESITVFPEHFEITIAGSPPLIVLPGEVGLKHSENVGVGGGT